MKLNTTYFGEIEIDESKVITFESGIPGFSEQKEFALIDIEGNPMFQALQSIDNQELAFVVTDPFLIYKNYEFDLDEQVIEQLDLETNEQLIIRCMITVNKPFEESTINLKAPVIFNKEKMIAKQIVVKEEQYHTKHPIQIKGGE
ncbi:flagellar assembly protein FliW [Tenuibacillus multivorans]|uniref:Flagellar assembly factor FliW n=1 Tax=Tenuibacillus multivorans TaxID=237069 RepID=A0A1H0G807_9BACI|nr:flagellar assembly protein FliW [Tenuibacillus multivorans]GEL78708.1 flagellar assembly factor FliW [Tenuibacillus multivorans]SDO02980.1 flagellar assembly factor FliW [Tenuibacillus multivorans]